MTHQVEYEGERTAITTEDLQWAMMKDSDYLDAVTLFVYPPSGGIIFVQVLITNLGLTSHCGVQAKYFDANGTYLHCKDEHSMSHFTLGDDKISCKIGQATVLDYDAERQVYRLEVDLAQKGFACNLEFSTGDVEGYKIGDGKAYYSEDHSKFQFLCYPMPQARITGTCTWTLPKKKSKGGSGEARAPGPIQCTRVPGFVSHSICNLKGHKVATHWNLGKFYSRERETTLNFTVIQPPFRDAPHVANACLIRDGELVFASKEADVEVLSSTKDPASGYDVPTGLKYTIRGTDKNGELITCHITVPAATQSHVMDVLSHLPWLLRKFIQSFIAKPFFYTYLDDATVSIHVGDGDATGYRGNLLHEVLFVNNDIH